MTRFDAVIVGGGPRAVATIVRLVARLQGGSSAPVSAEPVSVAIIDAVEIGAGATWRTDQTPAYLNNTTVAATTVHADSSTPMAGPIVPGPDLGDWLAAVVERGEHPYGSWVVEEARGLTRDDFPSRRIQGVYYRDQLDAAIATGLVHVEEYIDTVTDVIADDEDRLVQLASGRTLAASTVVLAQGMVQALPGSQERELRSAAERYGLTYIAPGMPAEQPWHLLAERTPRTVLVRGLGANFFDVMGDLALTWGGVFDEVPGDPHSRLRYLPTGQEPLVYAGSRRGWPYRSKPDPQAERGGFTPLYATASWFASLERSRELSLLDDVWPTLAKEMAAAHLKALEQRSERLVHGDWRASLGAAESVVAVDAVLTSSVTDERWRFTIDQLHRPTGGDAVTAAKWQQLVERMIDDELGSMSEPAAHPRQAVNRVMSELRGKVARLSTLGVLSGASITDDLHGWFDGDSLFLASGPPSHRVRQVLALMEAGILQLIGPEAEIAVDDEQRQFVLSSPITSLRAASDTLVETRMSKGKVPHTSDPLLQALLADGRARIHTIDGSRTDSIETAAGSHALVSGSGESDPAVVVLGIPALSTQPGSAIGATPGKPSPLLAGADVAAAQILRLRRA